MNMARYEKGLVSVVIPTYKRSELLQKAIDSVLNQTYKNIQLIVVNDNIIGDEYSQELYKLIENIHDDRLIFLEQEKHINGAAARNVGIRRATGEYIAFQDDDDYWEPEKIERQVALLSSLDKTWGAVSCLMRIYSHEKLVLAHLPYRDGSILMDILDRRTSMGTGALLIRREALDDVGYFDEALMRHQDLQLFAALTAKYKVKLDRVYLHNRENKDAQNRPSADKLQAIKDAYFASIGYIMDTLTPAQRKRVRIMHDFECAYAFYRSGKKKDALKKAFGIFKSPITLYLAVERTVIRFLSKTFRNYYDRKYSVKK